MEEACKMLSLCHEEGCVGLGDDHSGAASISGASSGSPCSSTSNPSDDADFSPPEHCSELSSASSSTLHLDSAGPLYELSSLLAQLPVRRGLSQSFTSISDATCLEDLAKEITYNKRMKTCKSYAAELEMNHRSNHLPRPSNKMIAKRPSKASAFRLPCLNLSIFGTGKILSKGINAVIRDTQLVGTIDVLDAIEDEYGGVIVDPTFLPNSSNAFSASLQSSLSYWSQQGKRGVWLKILEGQADIVPIAIKAGFIFHHAEPGYVMLTLWLPDGPSALLSTSLHQIGVGAFVINGKREFEDLFSGVVREVREETGIKSSFLDVVAFRHAHQVTFDKSDILFVCTPKPLSFDISIDESEIEAARWMPLDECINQPYHQEDEMCKTIIDICIDIRSAIHDLLLIR